MEGRTYSVSWQHQDGVWTLSLKGKLKIRTSGTTLDAALERLTEAVGDANGDFEPQFTFTKPLPPSVALEPFLQDDLCVIGGTGGFDFVAAPVERFFTGGKCEHCRFACGKRTLEPKRIAVGMSEDVGSATRLYVSERFLEQLSPEERSCAEWRLCERLRPAKRKIFELVPTCFVEPVVPEGIEAVGWQCPRCQDSHFSCIIGGEPITIISRSSNDVTFAPLFAIGTPANHRVAMHGSRVRELLAGSCAKGLYSEPLGVVNAQDVVRPLPLASISAEEIKQLGWG